MKNDLNVILIGIDALRADRLGTYGYHRPVSPAIDEFAKNSVVFKNCFSQAPFTTPSFMSILTSLYPTYHGVTDIIGNLGSQGRGYALDPKIHTLAEVLKNNNYRTAAFTDGGQLYNKFGFDKGFDYYSMNHNHLFHPKGSIPTEDIFYWLKEYKNEKFFLFLHSYAVHSPWMVPQSYLDMFATEWLAKIDRESFKPFRMSDFLEDPSLKNMSVIDIYLNFYSKMVDFRNPRHIIYLQSLYDGAIKYVDDFISKLLNYLQELNIFNETVIIFLSDHGEEFLDHGRLRHQQLYNELLHIPLILRAPGLPEGTVVTQLTRSIDIFPTILDILNIPFNFPIHGTSLLPSLKRELNLVSLAETESRGYSIQNKEFKYIYPRYKFLKERTDELYDIQNDPGEKNNIALKKLNMVEEMNYAFHCELHSNPNINIPRRKIMYTAGDNELRQKVIDKHKAGNNSF